MPNQLHSDLVRITDGIAKDLRLATREAVNKSAEVVTLDARRRLQSVIGPEQRMSHVTRRKRGDKGGRTTRVTAETIGKGGTRINPYYRSASSETNPVALIGVRGPAQYVEHPRRGGYDVKPLRVAGTGGIPAAARTAAAVFGGSATLAESRLRHPALRTPEGPRGRVRPGPITTPRAPITKAFRAAPRTIAQAARDELERGIRRRIGR